MHERQGQETDGKGQRKKGKGERPEHGKVFTDNTTRDICGARWTPSSVL